VTPADIENLLRANMDIARVEVRSDDNVHFQALVVSNEFSGKRPVQRHQMVYACLGDGMREDIHALSIRALTPEEFAAG
jgi:acid stress-induced BolA-like protein IbaG/YrbA